MNQAVAPPAVAPGRVFRKETLRDGKPAALRCVNILGQTFSISGGPLAILALEDEWYEDVADPEAVIRACRNDSAFRADLFTFWQRMPDVRPRFAFHQEWEEIAVLALTSYEHWWNRQINAKARNMVRKAEKQGVVVKEVAYTDEFIRGMTAIFNETPVRQGRRFWHYGKDFDTVKRQFSRFVFREQMIGAYHQEEMIGFVMLGNAGRFAIPGQIISSIRHRDKAVSNALVAHVVKLCEAQRLPYLIYMYWSHDSLSDFKRHCGFEPVQVPRYYVPFTWKGRLALQCGAHRGWKAMLPRALATPLKRARGAWHESHAKPGVRA
jgi:hypothetical protein